MTVCSTLKPVKKSQGWPNGCYELHDTKAPERVWNQTGGRSNPWRKIPSIYLVEEVERLEQQQRKKRRHVKGKCHNSLPPSPSSYNLRSTSPWTYRINVDEDRYPQKLAFAECLCSGCIDLWSNRETLRMNSVLLEQSVLVLRRKPCPANPRLTSYELDHIMVPVGCTCLKPRMAYA
ncbi:interleukin-17C-like [Ornithorhynchus anatinus]|uniref:Interleukin 17C n=1 Tax=Ornithorhynchus anatinus TaxID=9258 RepID=K7EGJ1_ORNAN|nr:interleukin-17C-like [Ornithorhynchus anatinus]